MTHRVSSVFIDRRSGMAAPPNIRLDLANRAENVVLVRETLAGAAEAIGLEAADLDDIRTAVTEACNNVVLHAYEGEEGPLEVEVYAAGSSVEVFVRDHGIGLRRPSGGDDPWVIGIGLPVIEALAQQVEFAETSGGGTEVRMEFATPGARTLEPPARELLERHTGSPTGAGRTTVTIAPVAPLSRSILPRLLGVLAARANFSTDRISDALMLADALGANASGSTSAGHLTITVNVGPRNLELKLGPLDAGRGESLVSGSDVEGVGRVIEKLSDHHSVALDGSSEVLDLRLTDLR
jgi:anti-sigma regulatory factor (Ser/Thr protein kinase)